MQLNLSESVSILHDFKTHSQSFIYSIICVKDSFEFELGSCISLRMGLEMLFLKFGHSVIDYHYPEYLCCYATMMFVKGKL